MTTSSSSGSRSITRSDVVIKFKFRRDWRIVILDLLFARNPGFQGETTRGKMKIVLKTPVLRG